MKQLLVCVGKRKGALSCWLVCVRESELLMCIIVYYYIMCIFPVGIINHLKLQKVILSSYSSLWPYVCLLSVCGSSVDSDLQ